MSMKTPQHILIIGINGGLAQLTAKQLLQKYPKVKITGVDSRSIKDSINDPRMQLQHIRYSRNDFENLFRDHAFDVVFHLARVTHSSKSASALKKRLEINLIGTKTILDLCLTSHVKKIIIFSTFHVYGALSDNPIYIDENMPLRASMKYPELRDVVEMDQICSSWLWQHQQKCAMILFRPCHIIGPNISNAMTKFLKNPVAINPIDYNPMIQFLHELDMAKILADSIQKIPSGIYNIAPEDYISLQESIELLHGDHHILFPLSLLGVLNQGLNYFNLGVAPYLIDYLKFSCLISNEEIKKAMPQFHLEFTSKQAIESLKTTK